MLFVTVRLQENENFISSVLRPHIIAKNAVFDSKVTYQIFFAHLE